MRLIRQKALYIIRKEAGKELKKITPKVKKKKEISKELKKITPKVKKKKEISKELEEQFKNFTIEDFANLLKKTSD